MFGYSAKRGSNSSFVITGFLKNNYTFKIKLVNFIDILIKELMEVFGYLEEKLSILFDLHDSYLLW